MQVPPAFGIGRRKQGWLHCFAVPPQPEINHQEGRRHGDEVAAPAVGNENRVSPVEAFK